MMKRTLSVVFISMALFLGSGYVDAGLAMMGGRGQGGGGGMGGHGGGGGHGVRQGGQWGGSTMGTGSMRQGGSMPAGRGGSGDQRMRSDSGETRYDNGHRQDAIHHQDDGQPHHDVEEMVMSPDQGR